jgi:hypothetical protein
MSSTPSLAAGQASPSKERADRPAVLPYGRCPHCLMSDTRLPPLARLIVPALEYFARRADLCWPSNGKLAAYVGTSVATVRRGLDTLEAAGHIRREKVKPARGNMTGREIHLLWRSPQRVAHSDAQPPSSPPDPRVAHQDEQPGCAETGGELRTQVSSEEDRSVPPRTKPIESEEQKQASPLQRNDQTPEPAPERENSAYITRPPDRG